MNEVDAMLFIRENCYDERDDEKNHLNADKALCDFLRYNGYSDLVDAYERVTKYYS